MTKEGATSPAAEGRKPLDAEVEEKKAAKKRKDRDESESESEGRGRRKREEMKAREDASASKKRKDRDESEAEGGGTRKREKEAREGKATGTDESESDEPNLGLFLSKFGLFKITKCLNSQTMVLKTIWPWTVRASYDMPDFKMQREALQLHGLFGERNIEREVTPEVAMKVQNVVETMDPIARASMHFHWPSLKPNRYHSPSNIAVDLSNEYHWAHEYIKHGELSGLGREQYFLLTLAIFHRLTSGLKLKTNELKPISEYMHEFKNHAAAKGIPHAPNLHFLPRNKLPVMYKRMKNGKLPGKGVVFKGLSTFVKKINGVLEFVPSSTSARANEQTQLIKGSKKKMMSIPGRRRFEQ